MFTTHTDETDTSRSKGAKRNSGFGTSKFRCYLRKSCGELTTLLQQHKLSTDKGESQRIKENRYLLLPPKPQQLSACSLLSSSSEHTSSNDPEIVSSFYSPNLNLSRQDRQSDMSREMGVTSAGTALLSEASGVDGQRVHTEAYSTTQTSSSFSLFRSAPVERKLSISDLQNAKIVKNFSDSSSNYPYEKMETFGAKSPQSLVFQTTQTKLHCLNRRASVPGRSGQVKPQRERRRSLLSNQQQHQRQQRQQQQQEQEQKSWNMSDLMGYVNMQGQISGAGSDRAERVRGKLCNTKVRKASTSFGSDKK